MVRTTSDVEREISQKARFSARALALTALFSLLTSPITAVWFWLLGSLLLLFSVVAAAVTRRSLVQSERVLRIGASVGLGLLVGPLVFFALALVR
jgi:hypothetical protein